MKKLLVFAVCSTLVSNVMFASFPVNTEKKDNKIETVVGSNDVVSTIQNADESAFDQVDAKEMKKAVKKAKAEKSESGADRELVITLLLWFFLGGFAAHRWYKGKPAGWNILFILTAGGCGIWAIVDLVNILTGKF